MSSNCNLSVCFLLTFLVISDKKSYKRNAAQVERVLYEKKRPCRIVSPCDILSPLRIPSPVGRADE